MSENKDGLKKFVDTAAAEFTNFAGSVDPAAVEKAAKLILAAEKTHNRVHVTGIGKPAHVAGYAASLMSSTGTPTYELHGTEAVHGSAGQVVPGDVVIALSNSGETAELKATVTTLRKNGAKIISVTGGRESWLAKNSDAFLFAGVREEGDTIGKPPRASILAEIFILQCLSLVLQYEQNLQLEKYLTWHPGGSIGQSGRK